MKLDGRITWGCQSDNRAGVLHASVLDTTRRWLGSLGHGLKSPVDLNEVVFVHWRCLLRRGIEDEEVHQLVRRDLNAI